MKILSHIYGKGRVRVLRVQRKAAGHEIKEVTVNAMLEGAFERAYTASDNSPVVPTDTIKNTIHVLAKEHLGGDIEPFSLALGRHFLARYAQVTKSTVAIEETPWQRMNFGGRPHPHSFIGLDAGRPLARVTCTRNSEQVESGVMDLPILKSTGSGFAGFPRDEFTTLPETTDRILATKLKAVWTFARNPADFSTTNRAILEAMLRVFAENYSPSVQATIHQMGEAAFKTAPEISRVTLTMPNKHYLLLNFAPFGQENKNEVFLPTDEPHGQIEATLARDGP